MPRLRLLGSLLALVLLTVACSSGPAPSPTAAPAARPTEAPKPAAPAASPPPPASASPAASPAAAASPATAASPAAPPQPGGCRRERPRRASACASGWSPTSARWTTRASTSRPGRASSRRQRELGAEVKFIETTDPKDYGKNIDQFAQDGYDVIVTVGFALGAGDRGRRRTSTKNVKFIGVDQFQEKPSTTWPA